MFQLSDKLLERDISDEFWREYDFEGRVYRITAPKKLFLRLGGSTHRVVDNLNVTHCVPAPGVAGCVLRWQSDPAKPVSF